MTIDTVKNQRELIAPAGDPKVGYQVFSILSEIIEYKDGKGLPEKWNRMAELTRNKHWKQKSSKSGLVTANILFAHRQRTINMLTDNNPTFNVSRMGMASDEDEDVATIILRMAEFWWNDQEQQKLFEKSVSCAEEAGACVEKAIFNPDMGPNGEVEVLNVPLFNVGFYPVNISDDKKAEAILHYYPMSIREARRKWPEYSDLIVPDDEILKEIGDNRSEIASKGFSKNSGYLTTFLSTIKHVFNSIGTVESASDEVLIVEAWVKDYTQVQVSVEQYEDDSGQIMQIVQPKYRGFIRRIRTCNAGKIVLDDQDNPSINPNIPVEHAVNSYLWDKFPFSIAQSITDTVSMFGMTDYEQLEQLNIEVDKSISQLTIMKDKAARLKLINPKDSGVPNSHLDNKPGILNPSNAMVAAGIRYMDGPKIPAELLSALEIYKDLFFTISGAFDMDQAGGIGKDVIAYKAIAALIERASTMMKGKLRNYSKLIRERGRMYVSLAQNWYTEERWITYDDDGNEEAMPIVGPKLLFPVKLSVVSGSTMPRAKIQEREEAIVLFKMGAIPLSELYRKLDMTNRKEVLKQMQEGPFGELISKLAAIGMPEVLIKLIQSVSNMDEKQIEKAIKSGSMPDIPSLLKRVINMTENQQDNYAEMAKQLEIGKMNAEVLLIQERAKTEQIKQIAAISGVQFDSESIKQNWTKILAMIKDQNSKNDKAFLDTGLRAIHSSNAIKSGGQYNERGMPSNNKL